jgi:biopolymer transport protein ExbD
VKIPNYRGTTSVNINMTPMIDVTFLLIIFFLVSSHLAKQENFLPLDLPTASAGAPDFSDKPTATVQVLASGEYQMNGQAMALEQVRKSLQHRMSVESEPIRIRIRTDRQTEYMHVASLLKICAILQCEVLFAVYDETAQ